MEELIQAVLEAMNADPIRPEGSFRTVEFQEKYQQETGIRISDKKAVRILKQLKEQGKVEVVEYIPYKDVLDRHTAVRGWKLTKGT